jgi:hypothetical protein
MIAMANAPPVRCLRILNSTDLPSQLPSIPLQLEDDATAYRAD